MTNPEPKNIDANESRLLIEWSDGTTKEYPARLLRQSCQCAYCISELTGELLLKKDEVVSDIKITSAQPIGNYAISLGFSDGHTTGIFSYDLLYEVKP